MLAVLPLWCAALVVNITSANWDDLSQRGPMIFIAFTPWCPHSRAVLPIWNQLEAVYEADPELIVARLNCTEEGYLCLNQMEIPAYPSFGGATGSGWWVYRMLERTLDSFRVTAERIRKKNADFRALTSTRRGATFVALMQASDVSARNIVLRAAADCGALLNKHLFLWFEDEAVVTPHLWYYVDGVQVGQMPRGLSHAGAVEFIRLHGPGASLRALPDLVGLAVGLNQQVTFDMVSDWSVEAGFRTRVWEVDAGKAVRMFGLHEGEFPLMVFVDWSKFLYTVLPKVDENAIFAFADAVLAGSARSVPLWADDAADQPEALDDWLEILRSLE